MLTFEKWKSVGEFFDDDDKLTEETKHISVAGVEYIGHHEFMHGINWIEKEIIDRNTAVMNGTTPPEGVEEELMLILNQEINKALAEEISQRIAKNVKNADSDNVKNFLKMWKA